MRPALRQVLLGGGWWQRGAAVDLDFANSRYYGGSLASLLSTTRAQTVSSYATTSTGALTAFAANTSRITDLGLLVEEARTNAVTQSQTFNNAAWTAANVTATDNVTAAPDGTLTAASIVQTATTSTHQVTHATISAVNATVYTASVYAKAYGGGRYTTFGMTDASTGGVYAYFDLVGGVISQAVTNGGSWTAGSASITALANGWYRLVVTGTLGANSQANIEAYQSAVGTGTETPSFAGNTSNGIYLWGAQREVGSFPTSYIPTTTVAVARNADNVQAAGALLAGLQVSAGSIVSSLSSGYSNTVAVAVLGEGGSARTMIGLSSGTPPTPRTTWNGSGTQLATANTTARTAAIKLGMSWDGAGRSMVGNNGTVATDANTVEAISSAQVGATSSAGNYLDGPISRLTVWNSRLPDATLKAFTQ